MASLLIRGVGLLARSLAGLNFTQPTRCSSLPSALSVMQCTASRWFSKNISTDDFPRAPPPVEPPKRPLSSYFRFARDRRSSVAKQHPEASVLELSTLIGAEWRQLSETERQAYIDDARVDLLNYRESMRKYKENLNPLDRDILKEKKNERQNKKKTMRLKREKTLLGKPKGCRSPFNIYLAEHYHEAVGESLPAKLIHMRYEWNHLSNDKKQVYIQLAEDDKIRHVNELKAWEEQMIEIGREDLIRYQQRNHLLKKRSAEKTFHDKAEKDHRAFRPFQGRKKNPRNHEE